MCERKLLEISEIPTVCSDTNFKVECQTLVDLPRKPNSMNNHTKLFG